jgi:hypothetical protein
VLFASSTRYAMLAAEPVQALAGWFRAASLYVCKPSLNALDGLHALQELLVGLGVLDDDLGLTVSRENQRVAGLLEAFEQFRRVALEVARRSCVRHAIVITRSTPS